jgi:hypothetical protein
VKDGAVRAMMAGSNSCATICRRPPGDSTFNQEVVGREPDHFARTPTNFSFGDRDNALPAIRRGLEHVALVGIGGEPELRFKRFGRDGTHDFAALT